MSDIALSPATTMANCMINVDWAWHVRGFQTARTKIPSIMLFGGLFHRWFISVDNSRQFWSTERGKLSQRLVDCAIGQWRHQLECVVQQQGIWCENCELLQLLWTITEAINRLFCCKIFLMCCYRYRLVFNGCFKDINILLGSVATHLRCGGIFSNSVTANFLLFPTV